MLGNLLLTRNDECRFPRREAKSFAEFELGKISEAEDQRIGFGVDYQYSLKLVVGTNFIANDVEVDYKRRTAEKQLRHALYKDVISDLYEIIGASSESEVQGIAAELISNLTGNK